MGASTQRIEKPAFEELQTAIQQLETWDEGLKGRTESWKFWFVEWEWEKVWFWWLGKSTGYITSTAVWGWVTTGTETLSAVTHCVRNGKVACFNCFTMWHQWQQWVAIFLQIRMKWIVDFHKGLWLEEISAVSRRGQGIPNIPGWSIIWFSRHPIGSIVHWQLQAWVDTRYPVQFTSVFWMMVWDLHNMQNKPESLWPAWWGRPCSPSNT